MTLFGELLGALWGWVLALLAALLGVLWGRVLLLSLFAAAVILNTLGVEDVSAGLHRTIDRADTAGPDAVETVRHLSPETVVAKM